MGLFTSLKTREGMRKGVGGERQREETNCKKIQKCIKPRALYSIVLCVKQRIQCQSIIKQILAILSAKSKSKWMPCKSSHVGYMCTGRWSLVTQS